MNGVLRWSTWWVTLASACLACGGEETLSGIDRPFRVRSAQFEAENIPGLPPLSVEELQAGVAPTPPNVTSFSLNASLVPGTPNVALQGRATTDVTAVALALPDAGPGYWVVPVGPPDPSFEGEYAWSANFDIGHSLAPGLHELVMAGIDGAGHSGTQATTRLCVASPIPDNLNACAPKRKPPETVISLSWDAPVDLDLQVLTPGGKWVDAKHPTDAALDSTGKIGNSSRVTGVLQEDGGAGCLGRGRLSEHLVFSERPPAGVYSLHANLYSACTQASVRFELSIWSAAEGEEPGTFRQKKTYSVVGIQLASQANQGTQRGQFLTELVVE
ncbi:MAG TPA: hypothetical protein VFQ61_26905 [Polyangiaceae bacterium]|nr:hypothetical protein [Polyangiaceae bacterium]